MGKIYKTAMGRSIDMEALSTQHANAIALGNMNVNAKGDRLGPNGEIVEYAGDRVKDYYENPKSIKKSVSMKGDEKENDIVIDEVKPKPEPVAQKPEQVKAKSSKKVGVEKELPDGSIEIVDPDFEEGNE